MKLTVALVFALVVSCGMSWLGRGGEKWAEGVLRRATRILPLGVGALAGHGIALWSTPFDAGAAGYAALLLAMSIVVVSCITIVTAGLHGAMASVNRGRF